LPNKISLVLPDEILHKIKYLCKNIPKVEWSGPLFYTHKGTITDPKNFEITIQDILPLDKGTAGYTSYTLDNRFVDYMMEDDKRLDWNMGHIHSHNTMGVFFSGVDTDELVDNAPCYNFYLSLIVNNYMDMVARVAFETTVEHTVKNVPQWAINQEGGKFIFKKEEVKVEKKYIYYYDCEIKSSKEVITVDDAFKFRVEEILKEKPVKVFTYTPVVKSVNTPTTTPAPTIAAANKIFTKDFKTFPQAFAKDFNFEDLLTPEEEDILDTFLIDIFSFGGTYTFEEHGLDYVIEELEETEGIDPINLARAVLDKYGEKYSTHFPEASAEEFIADAKYCIERLSDVEEIYSYIKPTIKGLQFMLNKFQELGV